VTSNPFVLSDVSVDEDVSDNAGGRHDASDEEESNPAYSSMDEGNDDYDREDLFM
jgi:hypothetical protein